MRTAIALLTIIVAAGCGRQDHERDAQNAVTAPAESGPADPAPDTLGDSVLVGDPPVAVPGPLTTPPRDWTHRTTRISRNATGVATITAFRTAAHDGFDRVVIEMEPAVPGYHIEYVDRPAYECGSGEPLYLAGDAWLLVRLQPARAHDDAGSATISPRRMTFENPVLREAAITCDFEADASLTLGVTAPGGYRVAEYAAPARLVIDLRN